MTEQTLTHFCSNPACQLHSVMVTPATVRICRELPGGIDEAHNRYGYPMAESIFLCEVCHEAVQLCTLAYEKELAEVVKQDAKVSIPIVHPMVAGLPTIDASSNVGEIWLPDMKVCGSA
jgi:hypothetical protein